jgi:Uma2 family endonuclease
MPLPETPNPNQAGESNMTTTRQLITADELLLLPRGDGRRYELIRGVLVEKMPAGKSQGIVASLIDYALVHYAISNDYGYTLTAEPGYRLERDPDTVRAPDVAWFAPGHLPEGVEGFPELAPDLAVEVKSPSNSYPEMAANAYMWLSYGSQQVWVADPSTTTVAIYRPNAAPVILREDEFLDGSELLPGFTSPVWRLFRRRR